MPQPQNLRFARQVNCLLWRVTQGAILAVTATTPTTTMTRSSKLQDTQLRIGRMNTKSPQSQHRNAAAQHP